jgi:hypothetical protein
MAMTRSARKPTKLLPSPRSNAMTSRVLSRALKSSRKLPWIRKFFFTFLKSFFPRNYLAKVYSKWDVMSSVLGSTHELSWAHECSRELPWVSMFFLWCFKNIFPNLTFGSLVKVCNKHDDILNACGSPQEVKRAPIIFLTNFLCVPPSQHLEKVSSKINAMSSAPMNMWKLSLAHGCSRELPWVRLFFLKNKLMFFSQQGV